MSRKGRSVIRAAGLAALALSAPLAVGQGGLAPPGPPAPMPKTLQQVGPRRPISSLPYTISEPGSYYLTTNLVAGAQQGGITVLADSVSLDLRGFALVGDAAAAGAAGIFAKATRAGLHIHDGSLVNWPGDGLFAGASRNSQSENLIVVGAGGIGMRLGDDWTVSGCAALSNGQAGIQLGSGGTIRDCAAYATRGVGIIAGGACVLSGCAAARNGTGISAGTGCDVSDCTASGNITNGFSVGAGSSVIGCTAATNGRDGVYAGNGCTVRACAASDNGRDGISVSNHSRVAECVAFRNQGDGIEVTANTLVDGNNCVHNLGIGIRVASVGNRIQGNQVEDNAFVGILCMLTNNYALVVRNNASGSGITNYGFTAITYDARPLTPTQDFVTDQPWANFDYPTP